MTTISLKERLKQDKQTIGSWITLAHPAIAEIMARAGFDWLVVDLEHSVITLREAEELIRTIALCGCTPLVRLSSNDPVQIKRVMDAGAHGILVPMVRTAEDARRAVAAVQYPPAGTRGVGLARAQGYGSTFNEYRRWLPEEAVVIVQVEHIDAVNNIEAILSTPGVDGYILGPYDLSASMGCPGEFDSSVVAGAMERVRKAGASHKKPGGIHIVEPDTALLRKYAQQGFRFVAYSVDIRMLDRVCRDAMAII